MLSLVINRSLTKDGIRFATKYHILYLPGTNAVISRVMLMNVIIIGLAGPSGSGKTTIANEIHQYYGDERCLKISLDNYYKDLRHLSAEEKMDVNFDHPDSIDFELLTIHLEQLKQKCTVKIPTYDFVTHSRTEGVEINPKPIIILEGIFALYEMPFMHFLDMKIFVDTDLDICFIRRLERDIRERGRHMQQIIEQYKRDVKPMYKAFVEPCKKNADIIIENTDENFETSNGLCFDIMPLITSIIAHEKTVSPMRFNWFSGPIGSEQTTNSLTNNTI